jgi:hypothetical protein
LQIFHAFKAIIDLCLYKIQCKEFRTSFNFTAILFQWQRTGSVSQGEDGMSTDTDELDDPDRLLLGGGTASSSHMMEKFRGVRNEMRRRILHTRDIIGDGKVCVSVLKHSPTLKIV